MISRQAIAALGSEADSDSLWVSAPASLTPSRDHVDVWRVSLDMPERERALLESSLSVAERERASRFRYSVDRARFVAAHGALRAILGGYLGVEPGCLNFSADRFGKPALDGPHRASAIEFNLSHSGGLALVAVSVGRRLGVDVERIDVARSGQEIAERFFSRSEVTALNALPRGQQTDAFFACWTRKEAYLKARGDGLSLPLDSFSVSVDSRRPAEILEHKGSAEGRPRWSLRDLLVGPGWAAALAVEGTWWRLRCWWRKDVASSQQTPCSRLDESCLRGRA